MKYDVERFSKAQFNVTTMEEIEINLPYKQVHLTLGNIKQNALKRFQSL